MPDFVPGGARLSPNFTGPGLQRAGGLPGGPNGAYSAPWLPPNMADPEKEQPVMLPFADKTGTGWHVIVRHHEGHERRIDGFATEQEALAWIVTNSGEVDK